jgi:arylsulfatase A-like enzyme
LRNRQREYLDNVVHYLDTSLWHRGLGSYSTKKVQYSHDLFIEESLRYLEENRDHPFFLYLPFTIPHNNGEERPGERQEVPDFGPYSDRDWPKETKGYAAMITRLDEGVGRILNKLGELGLEENTIVFFTSDNGPMPDMEFTRFFNSNGPYRGGKRDLYEGGIRVPMIVRWPGKVRQGSISGHVSAFWDFLPTACELAGLVIPEETDGISFLPELLGNEQPAHENLYWEFSEKGGKQAMRMGHWKLVRNDFFRVPGGQPELYDLSSDPGEEKDLSSEFPDTVRKLLAEIEKVRTESESFPFYTMK